MPGTGSPRNVSVTSVTGPFDQIDAPPGVQPGDTLTAIITSSGDLADIAITGGNPWMPQDERADPGALSTVVLVQVAGATNPTSYGIELGPDDTGLVAVLHTRGTTPTGMLLVSDAGGFTTHAVPCPDASPGIAGAVEVRYAAAVSLFNDGWIMGGYPVEDQDVSVGVDLDRAAYMGAKTTLSSADLPVRELVPDATSLDHWQSWTILIPPGDYVPPPPPTPAFAVRGRALYRYTAHDFLTGDYIDDLYPRDVTYEKRIGEPGPFTGTLPIPNRRVAAAVRRVIPKLKSDLTTGPGRIEIRIWRDGLLQPRYWLTGAHLACDDGKISILLRGSTLDASFYSVRIRDDREYVDGDEITIARSLLQHAQTLDGANIGLQFQPGTSGVSRSLLATKENNTTYGRTVQEFARGHFETVINETVDETGVVSTWTWGAPKLGTGTAHVFSSSPHGGDIASYGIDIDALRGGTDWEVRGGTPESTDATQPRLPVYSDPVATPHRAAGWPRIDHLTDHPNQSTDIDELNALNNRNAEVAGGAMWVRNITVYLGKHPTLTMNSLGDYARQVISDVWFEREDGGAGLDISERIIVISVQPTGRGRGKEIAVLTLETPEVP